MAVGSPSIVAHHLPLQLANPSDYVIHFSLCIDLLISDMLFIFTEPVCFAWMGKRNALTKMEMDM